MSSNDDFRRVHRLTPLLRFWSLLLALVAIFALNFNAEMAQDIVGYLQEGHWETLGLGSLLTLVGFVVACAAVWWVSGIWWRKLGFKLGDEEVSLRSGVISTSFRSARYDRIQAVDVVESVIARICNLAAVRVETAGGSNSVIQIAYLKKPEAEAVRAEILARLRRVQGAGDAPVAQTPDAPEGAELIPEIPVRRTLAAEALRIGNLIFVAVLAVAVLTPIPTSILLPFLIGAVPSLWNLIDSSWRFKGLYDSDQRVLDVSYGLADRRRQSIRLRRIHAVQVSQPLLWRFFGWYEVRVSVAGYGAQGGGKQSGSTRILPVGSWDQALALFDLVSDLSAEQIEDLARPEGYSRPDFVSPRRARVVSPFDARRQAVTLVEQDTPVAVVHTGLVCRRAAAVALSHIQELTYKAGPLHQALGLATVRFDLVTGPVSMAGADLAPEDAGALLTRLRARTLPQLEPDDAAAS